MQTKRSLFKVIFFTAIVLLALSSCGEAESKLEKTLIENNEEQEVDLGFSEILGTKWINQEDSSTAEIGFEIEGLKDAKGFFDNFDITFKVSEKGQSNAKLKVVIDVSSINTENSMRDKALMEDDFFNTGKYPTITFFSKNITKEENQYIANGIVEMMGVKNELSFYFKHKGITKNKSNIDVAIFEGEFKIDRTMFGMTHIPSVGDQVKVHFYCELVSK